MFQLVNHLTGHKPELLLPTRRSDKELADEFANFFFSKIVKIRKELYHHPLYQPSKSVITKLSNFRKLEEDQVKKLVLSNKSKSCELDPILTTLLKKFLPAIVRLLLKQGMESITSIKLQTHHQFAIYLKIGGKGNARTDQSPL